MSQPWLEPAMIHHIQRLLNSYQRWTGRELLRPLASPEATAAALFAAPFVVLSHGTEASPVLNYGNQQALQLWEMTWQELTQTPSRQTAEPDQQAARDRFLATAEQQGYVDNYEGIRISRSGKRFRINQVLLWNVIDEAGERIGQAATFQHWQWL